MAVLGFVAARGLSLVGAGRGYSSIVASPAAEHSSVEHAGFSGCGSQALEHWFSSCGSQA